MAAGRVKHKTILTKMQNLVLKNWQGDLTDACRQAGYRKPETAACGLLKNPAFKEQLEQMQYALAIERGKAVAQEVKVSPDNIINRLWELASMPPLGDAQNIAGQVKAAAELAEIFRMKVKLSEDLTAKAKDKTTDELIYAAIHGRWAESPEVAAAFVRGRASSPGANSAGTAVQ